jgi:phosphate-selective porin OprO/OprP
MTVGNRKSEGFKAVAAAVVLASFVFARPGLAADTTGQLLEILRANGTISAAQYDALLESASTGAASEDEDIARRLIDMLHANGTLDEAAYRKLTGEVPPTTATSTPGAAVEDDAEAVEVDEDEEGFDIDVGSGGVVIESKDGESSFALGGRVHVDAGWFDNDGDSDSGNATEVRRARIELDGKINRVWEYSFGVDFGDGKVALKSTYVSYVGFANLALNAGNWKEPFSLEELESSNYITFMERAAVNVLAPGRNPGVGVDAWGDHWTLGGGAFGEGDDDVHDDGVDGSYGFVGRGTFAPWTDAGRVLHFGAASEYRLYDDDAEVSFDEKWDTHLADEPLVDTGDIIGVDDIVRMGAEVGGVYGPLTAQAEWLGARVDRDDGAPTLLFQGWYVFGAWTLTGESRRYKANRGRFDGIDPDRPVGSGGWGAWQLALRYSELDLNDEDIEGGQQDVLSVGLNWYALRNLRFMANWIKVLELDRSGAPEDGAEPSVFQVRSQVNW